MGKTLNQQKHIKPVRDINSKNQQKKKDKQLNRQLKKQLKKEFEKMVKNISKL